MDLSPFILLLVLAISSAAAPDLARQEAQLSERFSRLELLAGRLAELSKATQPRRAELLRQLVSKSREEELPERFGVIVEALEQERLTEATADQSELEIQLQKMLELLLQEDRDRQLESERKRIARYLSEVNKLIRQERGIKARTAGGDKEPELAEDQARTAEAAGELGERIAQTEGPATENSAAKKSAAEKSAGEPSDGKSSDSPPGESQSEGSKSPESKPGESQSGESKSGKTSDSESPAGEPSGGKSGKSQKSSGSPSPPSGGSSEPSEGESSDEQQEEPTDRAAKNLRQAQERMQQAEERLKKDQSQEAIEEQEAALRELEQAKAELEKILRQLREEEMERMLVMLEARLRKMLEDQNAVYEQTIHLEKTFVKVPEHEQEIASATLARKEDQIVTQADRALLLLREDGTSVAFPEALQQAQEDMRTVADRLRSVKSDEITQGLEEDIIATLEETLAALQQALKDLREKKSSPQQGNSPPGEQALVDQLAELRMIRALQNRVNRRTEFYATQIEGVRTEDVELQKLLDNLSQRQEHIFHATRDLHQGANQ